MPEAEVAVYSSLSFLLGQLAILFKFGGLGVVPRGTDGWLTGVVGGPGVDVVVEARVIFVGAEVVFPVACLAIGLHGLVRFVGFAGTGSVFTADFGVMFSVVGVNGLDEGIQSVEVVWFSDSCNFILDAARKSIVELLVEDSVTPINFGGELLKVDNVFSNFLVIMH